MKIVTSTGDFDNVFETFEEKVGVFFPTITFVLSKPMCYTYEVPNKAKNYGGNT